MWGNYLSTSVDKQLIVLTCHTNYGSVTFGTDGERYLKKCYFHELVNLNMFLEHLSL